MRLAIALLRVAQATDLLRGAAAAGEEISPLQLRLLEDLHLHGPAGVGELAQRYGLSAATVSVSARALVERGLLVPRSDPSDARRRNLAPTRAGTRAARRALARLDALVRIAEEIDAPHRAQLLGDVVELIRRFEQDGWIERSRMCVTCRFFVRDAERGAARPHWCRLIERALGAGDLRLECPEHELGSELPPLPIR